MADEHENAKIVLHTVYSSSCAWRVRLALNFKGIPYEYSSVNFTDVGLPPEGFLKISPLGLVPVLEIDGVVIADSMAIIEYLEERFPNKKPLLPADLKQRAAVRQFVYHVTSNIQPLQNYRVLMKINAALGDEERLKWAQDAIVQGFTALEALVKKFTGKYCFGDEITLADAVLVPQAANAGRYKVDLGQFPTLDHIVKNLYELEIIQNSTPKKQPDYVPF